jgi:membrane protease YdiL (CAAX protease family)
VTTHTNDPVRGPRALLSQLHPKRFFLETWQRVDQESAQSRRTGSGYDYRPLIALAVGACTLTLMEYFGSSRVLFDLVDRAAIGRNEALAQLAVTLQDSRFFRLIQFIWWSAWRALAYFIIPALVVKLVFKARLRDYGLRPAGARNYLWLWGLCYLPMAAIIVVVSLRGDFASYYPFYHQARRSWFDLVSWELLYAAQFFSLEFFFRGFFLNACKHAMGSYAIFAMAVPYCMIHYGKPWPEAMSAIFAGIFLGTLAFKSGSIWVGFLIHESVALTMDVVALVVTGGLPHVWWP